MTAFGFLSTYPPTPCGVATFSTALPKHLTPQGSGDRAGVVRVVDAAQPAAHPVPDPGLAASMPAVCDRIAPARERSAVAGSFRTLAASLIGARAEAVA